MSGAFAIARALSVFTLVLTAHAAHAFSLAGYAVAGRFALPAAAKDVSAVTYDWDTHTLFVLGDRADALVEVTLDGALVGAMTLTGFADTEGVAYVGDGRFVLTEERRQDAFLLPYRAGGSAARESLASADLGTTIGNRGIEGISFDRRDGSYVLVKEAGPQEVNRATLDFDARSIAVSSLFPPALGVSDLADVAVLSGVTRLRGAPGADDLLIYSQESARLLHVTRAGRVVGSFDFSTFASDAEGVTISPDGTIYIVSERGSPRGGSTLFVLRKAA
jgi:uncharacterized protein YjiK